MVRGAGIWNRPGAVCRPASAHERAGVGIRCVGVAFGVSPDDPVGPRFRPLVRRVGFEPTTQWGPGRSPRIPIESIR